VFLKEINEVAEIDWRVEKFGALGGEAISALTPLTVSSLAEDKDPPEKFPAVFSTKRLLE